LFYREQNDRVSRKESEDLLELKKRIRGGSFAGRRKLSVFIVARLLPVPQQLFDKLL